MISVYDETAVVIAKTNDEFRQSGFGVTLTVGVQHLPDVSGLLKVVRGYSVFTEDNDPYHEHDFGSLTWQGEKVFWKIDYYDKSLTFGENPLSQECRRVLTVMLAEEY